MEKYYLVFDKVFGLIDIPYYNIDDVQKNKLFSDAIKEYIAVNKYRYPDYKIDVLLDFDVSD